MQRLFIDFETRSRCDLKIAGSDNYAKDPSTEVLCMAYCVDDHPVEIWVPGKPSNGNQLRGKFPEEFKEVWGHNIGGFDFAIWNEVCGKKYGFFPLDIEQVHDSMALANAMGLPGSLANMAAALGMSHQKDAEGHKIMMKLCKPGKDGKFIEEKDQPQLFQDLYAYAKQDIEVTRQAVSRMVKLSERERKIWVLDQKINQRGVRIDLKSAKAIHDIVVGEQERLNGELEKVTSGMVSTVGQHARFKQWMLKMGVTAKSIDKAYVIKTIDGWPKNNVPREIIDALLIRQEAAKSSTAKYKAMLDCQNNGRARNLFQYYGATTGRWAGRKIQLQNLPRSRMNQSDINECIKYAHFIPHGPDVIRMMHGSVMNVASECIRGMLIPTEGHTFVCADFSNIEGRGLVWEAREEWKLTFFRDFDAGKIKFDNYVMSYAKAFGIKPSDVISDQRQIGKVMELAFGYQGGVGAGQQMAKSYNVKISDAKMNELKEAWREVHPKVVSFWADLGEASLDAVRFPGKTFHVQGNAFRKRGSFLCCTLSSGRVMYYPYPEIWQQIWVKLIEGKEVKSKTFHGRTKQDAINQARVFCKKNKIEIKDIANYSSDVLVYKAQNSTTKKWEVCPTYGGSLAENITQAICRDILAEAMLRVEAAGYKIVMHVHDEIVAEVPKNSKTLTLERFERLMSEVPVWAEGFPIAAKGWSGDRYKKS